MRAPTLLIVGGRDEVVIELNRRARAAIPGRCELTIVPGATHLFEEPGALDRHQPGQLEPADRSHFSHRLSDIGASAEILVRGDGHEASAPDGSADKFLCLGPGWSSAANTPVRRHKTWVHEGGIATPLIAHWPQGIAARGELRHNPGHVIDVVPTILGVADEVEPVSGFQGSSETQVAVASGDVAGLAGGEGGDLFLDLASAAGIEEAEGEEAPSEAADTEPEEGADG